MEQTCEAAAGPKSPFQAFLENHNRVVGTIRVRSGEGPRPFDPARAACHRKIHGALTAVGDALRDAGYDNTPREGCLARLALGFTVGRRALDSALPEWALSDLVASGVAVESANGIRLHGAVFAAGPALAFVRRDGDRSDRVYLGEDSVLLRDAVRCLAVPGERAAELGTGAGLTAVSLASAYRLVVATDVVKGLVGGVALTTALNRMPAGHRVVACAADVAAGLRPGTFDFVAANTPWVPSGAARSVVYADGGPTGCELPSRFVMEGSRLLRAGGTGVFLMADVTFADGRSPLGDLRTRLEVAGFSTALLSTPYRCAEGRWERLVADVQGAIAARHVAVVVTKPPACEASAAALAQLKSTWETATPRR